MHFFFSPRRLTWENQDCPARVKPGQLAKFLCSERHLDILVVRQVGIPLGSKSKWGL